MSSKLFPERGSVRLRLLGQPAFVQIIPAILGLLAVKYDSVAEAKPEFKDRQGIDPVKVVAGIIPDDLFFEGIHGIMPLILVTWA